MNEHEEKRSYLIEAIQEIIERKGNSGAKAREIVDGILLPTVDQIALDFRILERMHISPRDIGS